MLKLPNDVVARIDLYWRERERELNPFRDQVRVLSDKKKSQSGLNPRDEALLNQAQDDYDLVLARYRMVEKPKVLCYISQSISDKVGQRQAIEYLERHPTQTAGRSSQPVLSPA